VQAGAPSSGPSPKTAGSMSTPG